MKTKILIISFVLANMVFQASAQSTANPQIICAGSNVYYKIPNSTVNSIFTWGIYNSEGNIVFGAGTDSIRVEWNNTIGIDSLWIFETNIAGCKGDTAKLKVVRVAPPSAEFNNSSLCYGESLNIVFTGYPPYNVKYTLDGNTVIQNEITQNPLLIGGASGEYILIQVSNKYCGTVALSGTINAVIGQQLQQLQIFHE